MNDKEIQNVPESQKKPTGYVALCQEVSILKKSVTTLEHTIMDLKATVESLQNSPHSQATQESMSVLREMHGKH